MSTPRAILHVDMDAFFAAVEQHDDPSLRGRPVLVGHDGPRGVVAAASYESRRFGCRSALPMSRARRMCPQAVVVPARGARYREVSERVFEIFESVTPLVEPLSIDEAFLDVTGSRALLGPPETIAALVKRRIAEATGLTCSVGVAPNKFLAKLASDWDKPDGLSVVRADELPGRLAELPIRLMWGVGPSTEVRLKAAGIATFGDLQRLDEGEARARLGEHGLHFRALALGRDERPVTPDGEARSLGHEQTFGSDVDSVEHVRGVLLDQLERAAIRLRRHGLVARTVTLKLRYGDFETITRSATLERATDRTDLLWRAARELFETWVRRAWRPVRLVGVSVSQLAPAGGGQASLFADPDDERQRRIDATTDAIRARFGAGAVQRGRARPGTAPETGGEALD